MSNIMCYIYMLLLVAGHYVVIYCCDFCVESKVDEKLEPNYLSCVGFDKTWKIENGDKKINKKRGKKISGSQLDLMFPMLRWVPFRAS